MQVFKKVAKKSAGYSSGSSGSSRVKRGRPYRLPIEVMDLVKQAVVEYSKTSGNAANSRSLRPVIRSVLRQNDIDDSVMKLSKSWINKLCVSLDLSYRRVTNAARKVSFFTLIGLRLTSLPTCFCL